MAPKYTILKALTQTSNKGFTLIELIVGLAITLIVGGLAMDAFLNASKMFRDDKRNIDNNQNLSAILELIGNDIKQAGEQINDSKFPVITIEDIKPGSPLIITEGIKPDSSKITIRRGLVPPLTLCEAITASGNPATTNRLVVADTTKITNSANCDPGTPLTPITSPVTLSIPKVLADAREYRCKLDDRSSNLCLATKASPDLEKVLAVMHDGSGNIRQFDYVDDQVDTVGTKFSMVTANLLPSTPADNGYAIGKPIYLIEERTYTLDSAGNLKVQRDGGDAEILIKGIDKFEVSARVYGDKDDKLPDLIDPAATEPYHVNILPKSRRCDAAIPYYICQFKSASFPNDEWKNLQGVKVKLQAKYDSTGRSVEHPTNPDLDPSEVKEAKKKLKAAAEFFPRNVLSK